MKRLIACMFFSLLLTVNFASAETQTINTLPSASATFIADLQDFLRDEVPDRNRTGSGTRVVSGGIGATDASLTHTISAVTAYVEGYYVYDASISHTYTASKDTFVLLRASTSTTVAIGDATITYDGNFIFAEDANATAQPNAPAGTMMLFEAVTDGTSITTVNDYRSGGIAFLSDSTFADGADGRLADAVATFGTLTVTLVIDCDDNVLDNTTVPTTMTLYSIQGNISAVASTKTLTINGPLKASMDQMFTGSGTVSFGTFARTVYPEWWGVDGTADQTQVQTAWDALAAVGGTVKLTKTAYSFNAAMSPSEDDVTLYISPSTTITLANASNCVMIYLEALNNITIEGEGTLDGNGVNQTYNVAYYGIYGLSCTNLKIRNITMTGSTSYGIHVTGVSGTHADKILVEDTYVLSSGNNGIAVREYVDNVRIINNIVDDSCLIHDGTGGIFVGRVGRNILVSGNTVTGTGMTADKAGNGIFVWGTETYGVRVVGNYVYDNNHLGIEIQAPNSVVAGNYVEANAIGETEEGGIWTGAEGTMIGSNVSVANGAYAFRVQDTSNVAVVGNVGLNSQTASSKGLRIYTTTNSVVAGNVFSDNQTPKTQGQGISNTADNVDIAFIGNIAKGNLTTNAITYQPNEENQRLGNIETRTATGYTYSTSLNYTTRLATVRTLSGNETFYNSDGEIFIRDPGGSSRNLWPSGNFEPGHVIYVINTADAAETITFDSTGLNQAVAQNQRGIFVYSGTAWLKVYVGS